MTTDTPEFGHMERVEVYFDELDSFRTLHHARYLTLVDRALAAYWAAQGYLNDGAAQAPDTFQLVRAVEITYDRPIQSYGPVLAHFWVERIGETSLVVGFRLLPVEGTRPVAHGRRVTVRIDPMSQRPAPWSDQARADLEKLMGSL